jgi:TolB-like protein/Tfp pilus assembly protein PilF
MDWLSNIRTWLSDNEAAISAVAAMIVIGGVLLAGLRLLVHRRSEGSTEKAPSVTTEPTPEAEASSANLDPLTVPGFEGRAAIAVLPFDNLSGDRDQEYFADGIAEDLITRLSAWRDFPVIARNSSFTYKGKPVDVKQVSRELGVRYVVEGSVRKAGDRVRISAQLIDATTGAHIWAETYDRELREIFTLQDEITEAIVASMHPELEKAEWERAVHKKPQDLDAWDCVQRASWHLFQTTNEENLKARALFEKATELDPHSVRAFAGLAMTHYHDMFHQWTESKERSAAEVLRAAERAVALDDHSVHAQSVLGLAYLATNQHGKAIAAYDLAVQLNPSAGGTYAHLCGIRTIAGDPIRAITDIGAAMRLSPKDPLMWLLLFQMAWACYVAERCEEAVDWAKRSLQRRPGLASSYRVLAASYVHLGQPEEARSAMDEAMRRQPDFSTSTWRSIVSGGDPVVPERYIEDLRKAGLPE